MVEHDTKIRILDAAECLFAENGFGGTSLREITAAADANLAAVNYHFGSKEMLIQAVFARFFEPINRERLELLDQVIASKGGPELEAVLHAFLDPALRSWKESERGPALVRLFSRAMIELGADFHELRDALFGEILKRFLPAFGRCLPHLSESELHWRFHFMIGAMSFSLHSQERMHDHAADLSCGEERQRMIQYLINYLMAAFEAPASEVPK